MSDFGEYKLVKTRKPHICVYCRRLIPAKSATYHQSGRFEGDWQNWYACQTCDSLTDDFFEFGHDNYIDGDEFNDWAYEQEWHICEECGSRYDVDHEFSADGLVLEMECTTCGNTWNKFIGFDPWREAQDDD